MGQVDTVDMTRPLELPLAQVIAKAISRALPSRKFVRLIQNWQSENEQSNGNAREVVTAALLRAVASSRTLPAILLGYLQQCLAAGLITAREIAIQILFLQSEPNPLSVATLTSLANVVLSNPTGLEAGDPLPSTLARPQALAREIPNVGTSASALGNAESVSTVGLLLPFLRLCSFGAIPTPTGPLVALVNRILSLLQPYPAPPLDIGLEAGGLFQSLPEALSVPLRDCLSGLMADLAVSQDVPRTQVTISSVITNTQTSSDPNQPSIGKETSGGVSTPSLPPIHPSWSPDESLAYVLSHIYHLSGMDAGSKDHLSPPHAHRDLIHLGAHLTADSETFTAGILRASIIHVHTALRSQKLDEVRWGWIFFVEHIPALLKWWRSIPTADWSCPNSLADILAATLKEEEEKIQAINDWAKNTHVELLSQAEQDEEVGGYSPPEGWEIKSIQDGLLARLAENGLLEARGLEKLSPTAALSHQLGEPLLDKISAASKSHLPSIAHVVLCSPKAARSLSSDLMAAVRACPQVAPPDNLFANLAAEPALLSVLRNVTDATVWMRSFESHLLQEQEELASRTDDPQGSLTRFGEGVLLVEAFVSDCKNNRLPPLLANARLAVSLGDLDQTHRGCVNGWVKALFGPDGIDDEILLATSPNLFYRLAAGVIQQSILATASGNLEKDQLHSGLSYFSQPLLSWSLVGIIGWLNSEIARNGLLSALHLDVLQNLILGASIPATILRVIGPDVSKLLSPAMGLEPVFQSSGFDAVGIRSKLVEAGIVVEQVIPPPSLVALRAQLSDRRGVNTTPASDYGALSESLNTSIAYDGSEAVVLTMVSESIRSGFAAQGDNLPYITALSSAFKRQPQPPLAVTLVNAVLPGLFNAQGPCAQSTDLPGVTTAIARLLKYTLVLTSSTDVSLGDQLSDHLLDELEYQRGRPVEGTTETKGQKRKRRAEGAKSMDERSRQVLDALIRALAGDEELRNRWSRFADLQEAS